MEIRNTRTFMRIVHRYLGYFMAGIMLIYAVSGVILIYRDTDFLKKEKHYDKVIAKNLTDSDLGKTLKMRELKTVSNKFNVRSFENGTYFASTGRVIYDKKELPFLLAKMTKLHKSESGDRFSPLNAFFGFCLFFFVISSFWMFNIKSKAFKRGIIFTLAGIVMAILLLFV